MNYTLAMPVFHSHPRMEKWIDHEEHEKKQAESDHRPKAVWVPIFKTLYESELIYEPEMSFDMELLQSKIPVVDHDRFVAECKNVVEYSIECGDLDPKRTAGFRVRLALIVLVSKCFPPRTIQEPSACESITVSILKNWFQIINCILV